MTDSYLPPTLEEMARCGAMTDNTQDLDEILNKAVVVNVQNSVPLMPSSERVVEVRLQYHKTIRRLILDWHNKQVEAVLKERIESDE